MTINNTILKTLKVLPLLGVVVLFVSCGGSDDTTPSSPSPQEEVVVYPTFDDPAWSTASIPVTTYEKSASMWLTLSTELTSNMTVPSINSGQAPSTNSIQAQDRLAVFCGDELRGVFEYNSKAEAWVALVYGNSKDKESFTVKYYQSSTRHMYQSTTLSFTINDTQFGTADKPVTIALSIIK